MPDRNNAFVTNLGNRPSSSRGSSRSAWLLGKFVLLGEFIGHLLTILTQGSSFDKAVYISS